MTCRHWRELDDDFESVFEYCKGKRAKCACSGEKDMCNFPQFFNADPGILEDVRREDAVERGVAAVEPFVMRTEYAKK